MSKSASKKRGFSLPEILVAVAIMAVVAAVVIPSIGSQLTKGDTARLTTDLINVKAGIEQFLADVRRYPSSMTQLQVKPGALVAADTGINATGMYAASQVARWKGPYLTKDVTAAQATGYGATMVAFFRTCNNLGLITACSAPGAGQKYLTIAVPGISQAEAFTADSAMDDGVLTTGALQWVAKGAGPADTLRFLALPIQ